MTNDPHRRGRVTAATIAVGLFVASYLAAAAVMAVVSGNAEFIFYLLVMAVMIVAIVVLHRRFDLHVIVLSALAVWGALHMAGGLVPVPEHWPIDGDVRVLYSWQIVGLPVWGWLKYDHVVHAYGYGVTTWLIWACVRRSREPAGPTHPGMLIVLVAAGCGFGALNEIVEFIATRLTDTNVGGYVNTGLDLIANLLGALVAAGIIMAWERRRFAAGCGL